MECAIGLQIADYHLNADIAARLPVAPALNDTSPRSRLVFDQTSGVFGMQNYPKAENQTKRPQYFPRADSSIQYPSYYIFDLWFSRAKRWLLSRDLRQQSPFNYAMILIKNPCNYRFIYGLPSMPQM